MKNNEKIMYVDSYFAGGTDEINVDIAILELLYDEYQVLPSLNYSNSTVETIEYNENTSAYIKKIFINNNIRRMLLSTTGISLKVYYDLTQENLDKNSKVLYPPYYSVYSDRSEEGNGKYVLVPFDDTFYINIKAFKAHKLILDRLVEIKE